MANTNMYNIESLTMIPSTNMDWFTRATLGGKLIERGKITPIIGVKDSTLLNKLDLNGNILQADSGNCGWTPQEIAKLSDKELKVKTYKINLEQCLDDLERKRTIWMLSDGARNSEIPETLEAATMALLATELSSEIEIKIFTGDSTKTGEFDGAIKVLKNSTEAIKVAGVALTKDNVLAEIEKVISNVPEAVLITGLEESSLNAFVSYATFLKVKMALGNVFGQNVVVNQNFTVDGDIIRYMGIEIVAAKGLTDSQIIVADAKNFIFGTDLVSDLEQMRLGQFPAPHDNKVFIDGRLRLGFVIPFEDEVVFYDSDNGETDPVAARMSTNTGGTTKVYEKTATQVIALIKEAQTIEEIDSLVEGDERKTVNDEANKRKAEIQANSTNTGGQ